MDALIERAWRAEATPHEIETLDGVASRVDRNEQQYRRTMSLLTSLRADRPTRRRCLRCKRFSSGRGKRVRLRRFVVAQAHASSPRGGSIRRDLAGGFAAWRARANPSVGFEGAARRKRRRASATRPPRSRWRPCSSSDGSVVRLAPNSTLRFVETATSRDATLDGRAYFTVAHNPDRVVPRSHAPWRCDRARYAVRAFDRCGRADARRRVGSRRPRGRCELRRGSRRRAERRSQWNGARAGTRPATGDDGGMGRKVLGVPRHAGARSRA